MSKTFLDCYPEPVESPLDRPRELWGYKITRQKPCGASMARVTAITVPHQNTETENLEEDKTCPKCGSGKSGMSVRALGHAGL